MAYSDRIIGRMVSNLWFQLGTRVPSASGSGSGSGSGGAAGSPPTHFGVPERVPELTYVSTLGEQSFLDSAVGYHDIYGLDPQRFDSLEDLIDDLEGGSGHIGRLRIVSHVGLNDETDEANMNTALFNGGEPFINRDMLTGFAVSDEAGLRSLIDSSSSFTDPSGPHLTDFVNESLEILRFLNPGVLSPVGLDSSGPSDPDLQRFLYACSDLLCLSLGASSSDYYELTYNGSPVTAAQRGHLADSLEIIAEDIKERMDGQTIGGATVSATQLTDLQTAITGLSFFDVHGPPPVYNSLVTNILSALRNSSSSTMQSLLQAFGIQSSAPPPGGVLEQYLKVCSDMLFKQLVFASANNGDITLGSNNLSGSQQSDLDQALSRLETAVGGRLAGSTSVSGAQVAQLRGAILGLGMSDLGYTNLGSYSYGYGHSGVSKSADYDYFRMLSSANAAIGRNFRDKLNSVRNRFDEHSWIDVRGCRIGQDRDYLTALRKFFGGDNDRPAVSGPEWYQSFQAPAAKPRGTEADFDDLWDNGFSSSSGTGNTAQVIQDTFDKVNPLAGIDIHIDFWDTLTNGDAITFAALLWKGELPALPIQAPRLDGFVGLDFSDTMTRISEIFDVGADLPGNAVLTRIENGHVQLAALETERDTVSQMASSGSPTGSELTDSFQRLKQLSQQLSLSTVPSSAPASLQLSHLQTYVEQLRKYFEIVVIPDGPADLYQVYRQVEELAAQSSPPAAQLNQRFQDLSQIQTNIGAAGIVPGSAPSSLSAAQLQGYIDQLIGHLNGSADFIAFKDAVDAKTQHGKAAFRYYFFIGLPLFVDEMNKWCYYYLNGHGNEAIRSFMRAQWQESLPSGNRIGSATMNQDDARRVSILSEEDDTGAEIAHYINPYPEFDDHIA